MSDAPDARSRYLSRLQAARALANAGRLAEAEADCRTLLGAAPDLPEAAALLGIIVARRERFQKARPLLEAAIDRRSDVPRWHFELARPHRRSFRPDAALDAARRAVRLDPHNPRYLKNLARVHFDRAEDEQGRACLLDALAVAPDDFDAHLALGIALLAGGEFAAGWREYQWRLRAPAHQNATPAMTRPVWNGMRLPGKRLLLVADQGHGDAFHFARFVPAAATRDAEVVLLCQPAQAPLFACLDGVHACVTDMAEVGEHAAFGWLASLPHVLGMDHAAPAPWLKPDPSRRAAWRAMFARRLAGPDLRVGLVWSGNPANSIDWRRSIALDRLLGPEPPAGIRWVSLQHVRDTDKAAMARVGIVDLSAELTDFGETAAAITNLDLVVTVDSAVAHLAGAMGVPTWILVHHPSDWRWLAGRDDSPWYPSVRLFRQPAAGDWDTPIRHPRAALTEWAGGAGGG